MILTKCLLISNVLDVTSEKSCAYTTADIYLDNLHPMKQSAGRKFVFEISHNENPQSASSTSSRKYQRCSFECKNSFAEDKITYHSATFFF